MDYFHYTTGYVWLLTTINPFAVPFREVKRTLQFVWQLIWTLIWQILLFLNLYHPILSQCQTFQDIPYPSPWLDRPKTPHLLRERSPTRKAQVCNC